MSTAAGLPLPSLSRGRFAYAFGSFLLEKGLSSMAPLGGEFCADGGVCEALVGEALPCSGLESEPHAGAVPMHSDGDTSSGLLCAYTDQALFEACGVRIAFTERSGGCSEAPFDSLNLKFGVGDSESAVGRNQAALISAFGIGSNPLIVPNQVHGSTVVEVPSVREYETARRAAASEAGCDAVAVAEGGVPVLLCFADCLPLILVAPGGAFAVVHCGWRSTVAHLAAKAFERLVAMSGCSPDQVNAYIGPYIHAECFEVRTEVAERFVDEFGHGVVRGGEPHLRWQVDLGAAVRADLVRCGCALERIADVGICTVCTTDRFFSYRAAGGVTGRHGAFAVRADGAVLEYE